MAKSPRSWETGISWCSWLGGSSTTKLYQPQTKAAVVAEIWRARGEAGGSIMVCRVAGTRGQGGWLWAGIDARPFTTILWVVWQVWGVPNSTRESLAGAIKGISSAQVNTIVHSTWWVGPECEVNHCTVWGGRGGGVDPNSASVYPQSLLQWCNAALTAASVAPADWWKDKMTFTVAPAGIRGAHGSGVTPPGVWFEAARSPCFLITFLTFMWGLSSFPGLFWCEFQALPGLLPPAPANKLLFW